MLFRSLIVALVCCFWLGCGGGDDDGSSSYDEQVERAKANTNPKLRARELTRVGIQRHGNKDTSGAELTFVDARTACNEIADPFEKAEELAVLAQAYARIGKKAVASTIITESQRVLSSAAAPSTPVKFHTKATAWAYLGRAYHEVDNAGEASSALSKAAAVADELTPEVIADEIELARTKAKILLSAASGFATLGDTQRAQQSLEKALEIAQGIAETKTQAAVLAEVAAVQHKHDAAAAAGTFEAAAAAARAVTDEYERVFAMAEVAETMRKIGLGERARALLDDAQGVADAMKKLDLKKEAQDRVKEARG